MPVALIVAAGSGERLAAGRPKALVPLLGRPLAAWSLQVLHELAEIERIVVALPPGVALGSVAQHAPERVSAVAGGASRSESVRLALAASAEAAAGAAGGGRPAAADQLVLVHDAARPLLSAELARAVLAAIAADAEAQAAIAAAPVTDTVKRVDRAGAVLETLDRRELWAVQTPQVFRRAALERALARPAHELARATDDAWLIEREGGKVVVVAAGTENLKVTTAHDLRVAELLLRERGAAGS